MRPNYLVSFKERDSLHSSGIASFQRLEDAVSFALALHGSSNIPHTVAVVNDAKSCVELNLIRPEDGNEMAQGHP